MPRATAGLEQGAALDAVNIDGNNALWMACVGERIDTMDMLLRAGIDMDHRVIPGLRLHRVGSCAHQPFGCLRHATCGDQRHARDPENRLFQSV